MLFFFVGSIMSAIMEGGGGLVATRLTTAHTEIVTTLTVANTDGFLKFGVVQMGNERVRYTNTTATTFTGCTRGYDNTDAVAHVAGRKVYSPESSALNSAVGFNVASTGATIGALDIPILIGQFFFTTVPRLISWDYAWLKEGNLQYLRYMFIAMSAGFMIYIALNIASALGGVLQRIWAR